MPTSDKHQYRDTCTVRSYRYYIPENRQSADDCYTVKSVFDADTADFIAEDAAKNYVYEHDGIEGPWPLLIVVLDEEKEIGRFEVHRELVPRYSARKPAEADRG